MDVSKEWKAHLSTAAAPEGVSSQPAAAAAANQTSNACECEPLSTPEKLEQCTVAFTGQVIDAHPPKKGKRALAFDVDEIFKGSPKQEMEIDADVSGTDCDMPCIVARQRDPAKREAVGGR